MRRRVALRRVVAAAGAAVVRQSAGHPKAAGVAINRLAGRKVIESRVCLDAFGLLRQMGAAAVIERRAPVEPDAAHADRA